MAVGLKVEEIAERYGVTPRRIQQMAQEGFFVRVARGRYLPKNEAIEFLQEPKEELCPSCGSTKREPTCQELFQENKDKAPIEYVALWFAGSLLEDFQNQTEAHGKVWSIGLLNPTDIAAIGKATIMLANASRTQDLGLSPESEEDRQEIGTLAMSVVLDEREKRNDDTRFIAERNLDWLRNHCKSAQKQISGG